MLFVVAKRGHAINTGKVLRGAPWQIVIFSLGMYLVVYGLRNAGLTESLSAVLNMLAEVKVLWAATFGTGFPDCVPVVCDEQYADGTYWRIVYRREHCVRHRQRGDGFMPNVGGCDLGPKITPIGSLATLLWLHVLAQKNMTITWGYYFPHGHNHDSARAVCHSGNALALRLSVTL